MLAYYYLAATLTLVSCGNVIFEDCGSTYELDVVQIEGCERTVPCYIRIGEQRNVSVYYKAGFVSTSLAEDVYVILNSVQTNTFISPKACQATECPVKIETISVYDTKLELPTNVALNTRGHLYWEIFNEKSNKVICFSITIQTLARINYTDFPEE